MDELVKAAQEEGELNVIALPPDWANYGEIISTFEEKYDIDINSDQPDGAIQDEINAANDLEGTDKAPDVFDLGQSVALANTDMFAPYQVETFDEIPAEFKDANGAWVNDYGGYMAIGYDSAKVPDVTSVADLLKPEYKGEVALNGDPTQAGAAFSGVMMAAIANGGSADDIAPGVDFFGDLKKAGNFLPVDPDSGTIEQRRDAGRHRLGLPRCRRGGQRLDTWKTVVPEEAVVAGYYFQAINADAPHPAAARLWQEFLYSDEGQNLWLAGGARPVRGDAMAEAGTIDADLWGALPEVTGTPVIPTDDADHHGRRVPRQQLVQGHQLSTSSRPGGRYRSTDRRRPVPRARCRSSASSRVFLLVPTLTVIIGAFQDEDRRLHDGQHRGPRSARRRSPPLKSVADPVGSTALLGAVLGAVLAYLVVSLPDAQRAAASDARARGRARPVRRRRPRLRLDRDLGLVGVHRAARRDARRRPLRLRLALRAARPDRRLLLLPDPADGHRLRAGHRGPAPPVARGGGQPRRDAPGSTGARSRSRC